MPTATPRDPLGLLGQTLDGRYHVHAALGDGDTGVVYHGEAVALRKPCAIKVLRPELQRDPSRLRQFVQACQRAMQIRSERLAVAADILTSDPWTATVTPLLTGEDLAARLRRTGRLSWAQARDLLLQICDGLRDIHTAGLSFGGLKPTNVFLSPTGEHGDSVRLLDVGVSRHDARTASAAYVSPEQVAGASTDARSAIYSLSALAFEVLTGRPVFDGVPAQVSAMHRYKSASSPAAAAPAAALPADIDALLLAGLDKGSVRLRRRRQHGRRPRAPCRDPEPAPGARPQARRP